MQKLLSFILTLDNLSRIPRTGGILFAGIDPNRTDSLAEHGFKTTYMCLILGKLLQKNGTQINFEKLLTAAVSHDWADCILLDIPSRSPSYKSYFKDIDIRAAHQNAEAQARLEIAEYIKPEVDLSLSDYGLSEVEDKLLNLADNLALLTEILEWKFEGMKLDWIDYMWANTFKRFSDSLTREFACLRPLADDLQKTFNSGSKPTNPFLTKPQHQTAKE